MRQAHLYGEAFTTVGEVRGAALWSPPGSGEPSLWQLARVGLLLTPFKAGLGQTARLLTLIGQIGRVHKRHLPARHWYLDFLGVDPQQRRQGIGRGLVDPVLSRADADRLPCYLDSSNSANIPFYEQLGFVVVEEYTIPRSQVRLWLMKREPGAAETDVRTKAAQAGRFRRRRPGERQSLSPSPLRRCSMAWRTCSRG